MSKNIPENITETPSGVAQQSLVPTRNNTPPKADKAIYVLPGYMGSKLYKGTDIRFLDQRPAFRQYPYEDMVNNNLYGSGEVANVLGADVERYGKDAYGVVDTYKILITELKNRFDRVMSCGVYDVKFFPYNWLGDINRSVEYLENDANSYDKIVIITHSTGALMASAYVCKNLVNQTKIEKLIMIAPPLYGTYAALLPLERGYSRADLLRFFEPLDVGTRNNWVKRITYNSPTTYQLLPSEEYFQNTNALDLELGAYYARFGYERNANWDKFYEVLSKSENINNALLFEDNNPRSHKNFRKKTLVFLDETTGVRTNFIGILQKLGAVVIGTVHGHRTHKSVVYSQFSGKLVEVKYDNDGDSTVFHTSMGFKIDNRSKTVISSMLKYFCFYKGSTPDHGGLVENKDVINEVIDLIDPPSIAKALPSNVTSNYKK